VKKENIFLYTDQNADPDPGTQKMRIQIRNPEMYRRYLRGAAEFIVATMLVKDFSPLGVLK